jgi:DNA-binding response OmpR family regulator
MIHGEMAGWDLLTELRQAAATQQVPVILISTSELLLTKAQDEHALWGGDRYLLKPFDLEELLTMIQNLIGPA